MPTPVSFSSLYATVTNQNSSITSSNLSIAGPVAVTGTLTASSNVSIAGALTTMSVATSSNVLVGGSLIASSNVMVNGTLTASSNLVVNGTLMASSNLVVKGGMSISGGSAVSTIQPFVGYMNSSFAVPSTSTYYPVLFGATPYASQGSTGISYNSSTGVFTNSSGSSTILSVTFNLNWGNGNSSGGYNMGQIFVNNSTIFAAANCTNTLYANGSATLLLNANDYFVLRVYQSSVNNNVVQAQIQITPMNPNVTIGSGNITSVQPAVCYGMSANGSIPSNNGVTPIFNTTLSSQGTTGMYNDTATGIFTNVTSQTLVLAVSYYMSFLGVSTTGIRQAYIIDNAGVNYGVQSIPGNAIDNSYLTGSAIIIVPVGGTIKLAMVQDSGIAMTYSGNFQIATLSSTLLSTYTPVQPVLSYYLSSNPGVGSGAWYDVVFSTLNTSTSQGSTGISYNSTNGYFTNTSGSTIVVSATYIVSWFSNASGSRTAGISCNGSRGAYGITTIAAVNGDSTVNTATATITLKPADYIYVSVIQQSASTVNLNYGLSGSSFTITPLSAGLIASSTVSPVQGNLLVTGATNSWNYPGDNSGNSGLISAGNVGMFRNRIINGSMSINQRAITTATYTTTSGTYLMDRFQILSQGGGSCTFSNVALTATDAPYQFGQRNSFRNTIATAYGTGTGVAIYHEQYIEGYNIQDFNWGTSFGSCVTLSFWFRGNGVTTLPITVSNSANSYSYNSNFTIGAQLTWQYVTVTIPAPPVASLGTWEMGSGALSGIGLKLYIGSWLGSNLPASGGWSNAYCVGTTASSTWFTTVGNYVEFTGVQLEKGSTNTPFEFRPYAVELQLCQRYYEVTNSILASSDTGTSGTGRAQWYYKAAKRANPTITMASGTNASVIDTACCDLGKAAFYINASGNATYVMVTAGTAANAEL